MALHPAKEEAILAWLNGLQLDQPVQRVTDLQDGNLLLKLIYKLKGEEPSQAPMHLPHAERVSIITDFLHSGCHVEECVLLTLAKGRMLELELTKAVLLLCHYGLVNSNLVPKVEYETELQMATMLRYVQQGASGLSLREGLDKLLTTGSLIYSSSVSSMSSLSDNGSPIFSRLHSSPLVRFVELDTVASSSFVGSPIQELMNTPQVQVKRLRKELAREGDVRDELEQELTERINLLSEKEGQISQLQYKLQRLQRDQEEMEKEHKATLTELQEKNNGLLTRVHEVLQQCRDLKTDNSQKERRIDGLMEENGTLAAQARNSLGQLARAEEEVAKISEAHDLSQKEWGNRRDLLQRELSQALTDKECLTERIQILEGKISILEDELEKLSQQPQEKGEVLGPIVEWEKLKQELADLSLKSSQLEETVSLLEKEKMAVETLLAEERSSFEKETLRLEGRVLDLHQSINNIQAEKEAQEQASKTTQETLTSQIAALETDLARLQQLEVQLTVEIAASAELRQQRGALEAKVASLEGMVNMLQSKCQNMEAGNITQQEVLDVVRADLQNAQISLVEYEKKLADHQKVVEENASLRARISALDDTIANLQTEIDAERKRGDELLTAKEQQKALMEEKFQKQEQKAHEMFTELETLSQELRKMKHQKVDSESCIEKLIQEGIDLKASLAEERDRSQSQLALVNKAREAREMELSHHQNKADNLQRQLLEVEGLSRQLTQEVLSKDGEVQHLKVELEQKEGEIHSLKVSLQSLEARSTEMRDLHQNEVEEERLVIMELKLQLAEAEKLLSEKVRTLEDFAQQLKNLKEELSIERQRVSTLENSLKTSKEAHEVQEQSLRLEVTQLQQEIDGHLKKLEESLNEMNSLKEEMSRQQDAALQKEQEVSVLASQNKSLEGNFSQLQNTLAEATALATERQTELLRLQEEVQHQENLRAKAQEIEETRCKELQTEVAELQVRVQELTVLASQREIEFGSLQEKMKEQEDYSQKLAQKSEETLQKELENIVDLKGQLESAKHQTAVKNKLLESMEERLKQMELMYQQKETCASEACQAKETLERKVNELYCMQKQDLDRYQQDLETLKKEKEHLSLVNESLQSEYQNLQMQSKEQQETLNALKVDFKNAQDGYQQELGILKKEKDHLASLSQSLENDCQNLQAENKVQLEELNVLKADLQNTQNGYQQEIETLKNVKEHLSSANQSLQHELQTLHAEKTGQQEELNALKADLQERKDKHEKDLEILRNEKGHLSSVNQSLQTECQALQLENNEQLETLNALKADLQNAQYGYRQELETLKNEQENLCSVNQSLRSMCQNLQAEKTGQQVELNALKADLQESKDKHEKDLESLKNEKEQLASLNQSLQSECRNLQAEKRGQQEELNALKVDLQESKAKYQKDLEISKCEKEHLSSVNQSLQSECQTLQAENKGQQEMLNALKEEIQNAQYGYCQELETLKKEQEHLHSENQSLRSDYQILQAEKTGQQEELNALKADLQESKDKHEKDLETLKNEKDHLASVNQSLHIDLEAAQKLGAEVLEEAVSELRLKQRQELEKYHQQLDALAKEKDTLTTVNHSLQAERKAQQEALNDLQSGLQQEVKTLKKEKEHLSSINQSLQRECDASQRLGADLEVELKGQTESIRAIKEALQKKEKQNQELQEQLRVKTETVEHYKVQVEKAKTHYNGKKQQLLEEQEARRTLQTSLETSESEAKALKSELKLVSMELEKIKASEKCLMVKVKSLETQLDYADRQLREQRKQEGQSVKVKHRESVHVKIPEHPQNASTESLELNLDDSLDAAGGKRSLPGESSTPLVRSSERLAAKRRTQDGGSLETLYFTPLMPRAKKREGAPQDHKLESSIMSLGELTLDSTKKQSSSVQRRRTTQVINITMTKKTPRGGAADDDTDESFFSLHSAQSQPNVASHRTRPVSAEIFDDHDKLLSLPGYRRSTAHGTVPPRTSSVFCLGSEYEPDHLADDWMRIAELQSRNKACLPHMKSSYPLESRPSLGFSHLPVTDEDVRTGDPHETIRRASMVPSQLKDSVTAHRLSLAPPAAVAHGHAPSQHAPQVSKAREVRSTRSPLASKRPAGQVQDLDTPEAKKFVSCFPRTPKGRNLRSISSQNIAPSLADRRQSMAFVIDNTPKKVARGDSSLLQRGISKLRKSPRTASTKSPKITSSAKKLMKLRMKI